MKKIHYLLVVALVCSSYINFDKNNGTPEDGIFYNLTMGKVDEGKKYYEAGCLTKKGEPAMIKCDFAPGKCNKEKPCTPITTLAYYFDDIEFLAADYANEMQAQGFIDAEDWDNSYTLAYSLLMEKLNEQALKNR